MRAMASTLSLAVAVGLLGGCATNTLRIERSTSLGEVGREAAKSTLALLDNVNTANRTTAIDIAALDPACILPSPVIATAASTGPKAFVCRVGDPLLSDFHIRRLDRRDFAPALTVVVALTDYLDAIKAIVGGTPVDVGAQFHETETKLNRAAGSLADLTGGNAPALTKAQSAAVASALTLIDTLVQEADKVGRLKRLETEASRTQFKATADALDAANRVWTIVLAQEVDKQANTAAFVLRLRPPPPGEMRALRVRQMDLIDRKAAVAELPRALNKTVEALREAHTAYLELLDDKNARLSREERRRKAQLIEDRALAGLDALAGLVTSF